MLRQLQLGQKIKRGQDSKTLKNEEQIFNIVSIYNDYVSNDDVLSYLKNVGYNVHL